VGGIDSVLLLKYNTNGTLAWATTYGGTGNNFAVDMTMDSSDNIYVTGIQHTATHGNDILVLKYSALGALLWVRVYRAVSFGVDNANAIKVDSTGNVFVAGMVTRADRDFAVLKYDTNGVFQWIYLYNGGTANESANALAIDSADNVVAVGQVLRGAGALDYLIVKLNGATGALSWIRTYNGANVNDFATAVAVDNSDNVVVTGRSFNAMSILDYVTIKYDIAGNFKWAKRYDSGGHDAATAIATDAQGNVYVTGESHANDTTRKDWLTIKYNTNGVSQWTKRLGNSQEDVPSLLFVDSSYNVYVGGYINRTAGSLAATASQDAYLVKYSATGSPLFTARYNGTANNVDDVEGFAVYGGDIYATFFTSTGTRGNIITIKYDLTP
jgi:uncharacterized delta-60 repeat protein